MQMIQDLGFETSRNWRVHYALYECPVCGSKFKANVNDVKRGRKKNCGCRFEYPPLPETLNGMKVLKDLGTNKDHRRRALFACTLCGNPYEASVSEMKAGRAKKHCGCYKKPRKEKAVIEPKQPRLTIVENVSLQYNLPMSEASKLYYIWGNMKRRCTTPSHPKYKLYGGRGISVCEAWLKSFEAFMNDVGPRPSIDLSLDRINNDGHYEPNNVRWTTMSVQQNNKRKPNKTTGPPS